MRLSERKARSEVIFSTSFIKYPFSPKDTPIFRCENDCEQGFYGFGCEEKCENCLENKCDPTSGVCLECPEGK